MCRVAIPPSVLESVPCKTVKLSDRGRAPKFEQLSCRDLRSWSFDVMFDVDVDRVWRERKDSEKGPERWLSNFFVRSFLFLCYDLIL